MHTLWIQLLRVLAMNIIVTCAICGESYKTRYYEQWQRGSFHVPAVWICDTHEMSSM